MTPEQQRIAIAEACGWTLDTKFDNCSTWVNPRGTYVGADLPPDYLNDLNAMHEAEKVLTDDQKRAFAMQWLPCVLIINGRYSRSQIEEFKFVNATAPQRAEAFLKTLNLYTPCTVHSS
jgi:hypothetical protein